MAYIVFALIAANILLAFTTVFNFAYVSVNGSSIWMNGTKLNMDISFWDFNSEVWDLITEYKNYITEHKNHQYITELKDMRWTYFWLAAATVLMYIAILLCVIFIVYAIVKAYSGINSNNSGTLSALKGLRLASLMAVFQIIFLFIIKINLQTNIDMSGSALSFTVWFYLLAIVSVGCLIAEIFLIKAQRSYNNNF